MAATLQTTLKNNLLSAMISAKSIPSLSVQIVGIQQAISLISYSERTLGLTPVTPTASQTVRTESEVITVLESAIVDLGVLIADGDYSTVSTLFIGAVNALAGAVESYRIFVN